MGKLFSSLAVLAGGGLLIAATAALAGNGVGGVFNLGQVNNVDARTNLKGTTTRQQLNVLNRSPARGSSAVFANSGGGTGVVAWSPFTALRAVGRSTTGTNFGVHATSASPDGYPGFFRNTDQSATLGKAVQGLSSLGTEDAIHPSGEFFDAAGEFSGPNGIIGAAHPNLDIGYGVIGLAAGQRGIGIYARGLNGSRALLANGNVDIVGNTAIDGTLTKAAGSFRIDHPLDPENKTLSHSFVESPDMMNVYNGNVRTDGRGEAVVELPGYFDALNRDPRYQLTVIGTPGDAYISQEVIGNEFAIKTTAPNMKVSWQVTGIRRDPYALAHPILVEEDKPENERGRYLQPLVYGKPASLSIHAVTQHGVPNAAAEAPVTGARSVVASQAAK